MKLVLDASSILSGRLTSLSGIEAFITPEVADEVSKGRSGANLQNLISAGLLVLTPSSIIEAERIARNTGDLDQLSAADISVIALALELKATVVTDDFRIQNVLRTAGLGYEPAGEIGDRTITTVWRWRYRCRGCGRYFEDKEPDCPVCGSDLKAVRSRG